MLDVTRFGSVPLSVAVALGFYLAYRLFGSTSETGIKLTMVMGFVLAALFCFVIVVVWDMIGRPGKRQ
jgi:hypothetical protein